MPGRADEAGTPQVCPSGLWMPGDLGLAQISAPHLPSRIMAVQVRSRRRRRGFGKRLPLGLLPLVRRQEDGCRRRFHVGARWRAWIGYGQRLRSPRVPSHSQSSGRERSSDCHHKGVSHAQMLRTRNRPSCMPNALISALQYHASIKAPYQERNTEKKFSGIRKDILWFPSSAA